MTLFRYLLAKTSPRWGILLFIVLLTSQCNIIRDLTTERPDSSKPGTTSSTSAAARKELALRQDIVDFAKKYQGTHYLYAGKKPSTGFDCSGFTSYVLGNFDISLSPSSRDQALQGKEKPLAKAQPGDLVVFRRSAREPVFHVALVIFNDGKKLEVIHSTSSRGVVIDDLMTSSYWKPKINEIRDVIKP
ncbi:MAG: C40 family peptidase [Lewinellaceae bacterium]|nr:C40 family peptidase [Lewinellaceae bacterium]